jgi:hypothetical protein
MNKKDVIMLIEEWLKSPPGSRPLLEKAISEQYRKALTSQLEGLKRDNLTQWLRENLHCHHDLNESEQDDLDNLVAALLDENEADTVKPDVTLPLAAYKTSDKQRKLFGGSLLPSDDEIARKVQEILSKL